MLRPMQQLLEAIYDVPSTHDVEDFLYTDPRLLPPALRQRDTPEQVVVAESDGETAIGVFLDEKVLRRLASGNPLKRLHGGNLSDFWTALEGVSHFHYLAWNAHHDRPVSLLELELQAEVDKYVASFWLLRRQHPRHWPRELRWLLFEGSCVSEELAGERSGLYATASRYASRFCHHMERALCSDRPLERAAALSELRRFYRGGLHRKLRHIESSC